MSPENYAGIVTILKEVKDIIDSPNTDVIWSGYETVKEAIEDLDLYIKKMSQSDEAVIEDVKYLFAPTGRLQEISIDSGWGDEFLEIAERFDELIKEG